MAKVKIVSDRLNTFFTNNRIATGTAAPTSGAWKVGDIVISTTQSGVIGWVCTIAGTPGTWETIQSKEDLSAAFAAKTHAHNYAGSSSDGGAATSALACTGNAATATKLQTPRTINGVSFDGTQNITIPVATHNHDSKYLKTNGDSGFWGNLLIDTSSSESKFKTTTGEGFFFNRIRLGMYDWTKDSEILAYKHETGELTLGSSIVTTKVNGPFYGANNIALNRGSLFIQSLANNATCDYLRFGTNILASNDSKQTYLIDMVGNRANLDVGHLTANSIRLTNGGYPALQFSNNVRIEYDAAGDALYAAGTKSSSSGFREFRATQCNSTVNAIIAGKKLFIQSGAPSGVSAGDVWIQV